jgi:peptide chain release factor subunit 1
MPDLDRDLVRRLATWAPDGVPVSSLYLDVDGRRHPRRQDYLTRAESLVQRLRTLADGLDREARTSVTRDAGRMHDYLDGMERGSARGVALFSSSEAGLWEEVLVPKPLPDRATVDRRPRVLPLEVLAETYVSICTVIVDRARARFVLVRMGQVVEERDLVDEVPGQHDQGGRSQARYQRHIEDHVEHHLRHVADDLLRFDQEHELDHLVLAGPEELLPHFEQRLHDYLRRRIAGRAPLAMRAPTAEILTRSLEVEERLEAERERTTLEDLVAEAAADRPVAVGLGATLEALGVGRVAMLAVRFGEERPGMACPACGRLTLRGKRCPACGAALEPVDDVVEAAVGAALGQGAAIESIAAWPAGVLEDAGVAARLRY